MEKSLNYKNANIHYVIEGDGTPLVLLHGFGEDRAIFDLQVEFLRQHFKLILPDLPGSGSSDLLSTSNASISDYADCIYALLQNENVTSCILLGHSMGGYITLAFAEKYPALLKGFGLIHSTAFADTEEKKDTRRKGIEFIEKHGAYPFLKNSIPNLFSSTFKEKEPEKVTALIEKGKQFSKEGLAEYYRAMINRPTRTEVLKNTTVPVLFILGTEDVAAPLNDLMQQVHLPYISHIHILEGVGHMGMLEAPAQVNEHIIDFVRSIES